MTKRENTMHIELARGIRAALAVPATLRAACYNSLADQDGLRLADLAYAATLLAVQAAEEDGEAIVTLPGWGEI